MGRRQQRERLLRQKAAEELGLRESDFVKVEAIARYFCAWGMLLAAGHIQDCTEDMENVDEILDFIDTTVKGTRGGCDAELIEVCGSKFQQYVEEVLTYNCS
ncbi:hypothetical protein SD70_29355 [Gordoniibacillus kamchatkensis]|uniref:Uncharacterized protein n=1 Tax=Gordoniibacillus kamchatkensis TaxID=1590651 RepID=A0ABR5AAB9_9BACL|nr:hypothetical protein [Paenibacillus sp. VKM B-2647]KIL38006.1 hypothetical protein SD70_29355 [Paenibacillus sp. VKM B-2647]